MKIGILGDLHLRATKPINRIDNYYENQFNKLKQAFETFKENECRFILQPGDFFHNYGKDPYNITYDVISFLILYHIPIYLVFGQHDIKFHNTNLTDIPIQILNKTDLITKLDNDPIKRNDVYIYGKNWEESWPTKTVRKSSALKILVAHQMVIKNKKLWKDQTDYYRAKDLCREKYDLIVSGDNHQSFSFKSPKNGNRLINCGSLMRMKIDQKEHKPIYSVYDTDTNELDIYYYDISPAEQVFKQKSEEKKDEEERKTEFSEKLSSKEFEGELNYRSNINKVIRNKRCRRRTKEIIEEALTYEQ